MPRFFYTKKNIESNFYPHEFAHEGVTLPTAEHHLMHKKATLMGDKESADKIKVAKSALVAKRLGRRVVPFDQGKWEENCEEIMEDILFSKFSSTSSMKQYLVNTEGPFFEASKKDKIWGIGLSIEAAERGDAHQGQNKLGRALDRAKARIVQDA